MHGSSTLDAQKILSTHSVASVVYNNISKQKELRAIKKFAAGDIIIPFSAGETLTEPNYLTVQIGIAEHITLVPDFLQYTNHSCRPNVFFDTTNRVLLAIRDIETMEELTFFYPSTELNMADSFDCFCGHKECLTHIKGAAYMATAILEQYRLTDFIKSQLHSKK